jgi:hypothetical protein
MFSRTSKAARVSWLVAYAFFLLAGIVALFAPSQLIVNALIEVLAYAWATFLTAGGGLCFGGKLKGNWAGEILGLPLLSAASYIFGILLLVRGSSSAAIAIGAMFCGVGTMMVGRWVEIRRLAKYNQGVNSGD